MPARLATGDRDFEARFAALLAAKRETDADVDAAVAAIVGDVIERGNAALIEHTARFDRVTLSAAQLRLSPEEVADAASRAPAESVAALRVAATRITSFHEKQRPQSLDYTDDVGVRLGMRWLPLASAGLYVPGGTAAYPSSVLMNAIPAKVAGVARLVMAMPAPEGVLNPLVMAAAQLVGIDEIYRIGGAQAVAALAYGTATVAPVDKIVGPGNAFVAAAKRRVFGRVGIDMIAGPSEILVAADAANDPSWIAADLLSQAEHDVSAQALLVTDDAGFAGQVEQAVEDHLTVLPRADIARESWERNGALIVVHDWDEAAAIVDRVAPEHLELALDQPEAFAHRVNHAGAIFLGRHAPEAIGDYIAGPNHVLPTARSARFASGLSVFDFMKRTTLVGCDAAALAALAPAAIRLAEAEGLDAHALSLAIRLNRRPTA